MIWHFFSLFKTFLQPLSSRNLPVKYYDLNKDDPYSVGLSSLTPYKFGMVDKIDFYFSVYHLKRAFATSGKSIVGAYFEGYLAFPSASVSYNLCLYKGYSSYSNLYIDDNLRFEVGENEPQKCERVSFKGVKKVSVEHFEVNGDGYLVLSYQERYRSVIFTDWLKVRGENAND